MLITISSDEKISVCTSIDREFQGGSNDMSCVALKCKLEIYGAFLIFNNSFLVITISRDDRDRSRVHQSMENFDPVIPICIILH